jgi:aminoglycoside phosphotransferase (APT) family kinase protein
MLRFVEVLDVPTPCLLAVDPTGDDAGAPAILMSRLPGRIDWWPKDVDRWLRGLAEILPRIHACPLPSPSGVIRPFAPNRQRNYEPPSWARHPAVWEEAVEIFHGPAPDEPAVFIQRDFHPGNVLWRYGRVSGVIDWQAASIGSAALDVAHCRANLLGYGCGVAERFTALWEQASGMTYHPWAEVLTMIGFLDDLREEDWGSESRLVEDHLAQAVAELRGGS